MRVTLGTEDVRQSLRHDEVRDVLLPPVLVRLALHERVVPENGEQQRRRASDGENNVQVGILAPGESCQLSSILSFMLVLKLSSIMASIGVSWECLGWATYLFPFVKGR